MFPGLKPNSFLKVLLLLTLSVLSTAPLLAQEIVKVGDHYSLVRNSKTITPADFESMKHFNGSKTDYYVLKRENKVAIIKKGDLSSTNWETVSFPYENAYLLKSQRHSDIEVVFKQNGKFGTLTKDLEPQLAPEYDTIYEVGIYGQAIVFQKDFKFGIIDNNWRVKTGIKPEILYDKIFPQKEDEAFISFKKGLKYGFQAAWRNETMSLKTAIIPAIYDAPVVHSGMFLYAKSGEKYDYYYNVEDVKKADNYKDLVHGSPNASLISLNTKKSISLQGAGEILETCIIYPNIFIGKGGSSPPQVINLVGSTTYPAISNAEGFRYVKLIDTTTQYDVHVVMSLPVLRSQASKGTVSETIFDPRTMKPLATFSFSENKTLTAEFLERDWDYVKLKAIEIGETDFRKADKKTFGYIHSRYYAYSPKKPENMLGTPLSRIGDRLHFQDITMQEIFSGLEEGEFYLHSLQKMSLT